MKKWLIETFLPMWAKQTVLADNRHLAKQLRLLQDENRELRAYVRGLENGLRTGKQVRIYQRGDSK